MKKTITQSLLFIGALLIMLLSGQESYAQSIVRQSITSYGSSKAVGNHSFSQTVGQPYSTKASNDQTTLPGFQQPVSMKIEKMEPTPIEELDVYIYPNPAKYSLFIKSKQTIEEGIVKVTNTQGTVVYSKQLSSLVNHEISCDSWSPGVYLISIQNSNNQQTVKKLVISK